MVAHGNDEGMRRRDAIAGGLGIGAVLLSGCVSEVAPSGPRNPPGEEDARSDDPSEPDGDDPGLHVSDFAFSEDGDGELLVTVAVANDATNERSGTVVVSVSVPDEDYEETAAVTVAAGGSETIELSVPVDYETFDRNGSAFAEVES